MNIQNPKPRTFAQLMAILEERNKKHGVKALSDVLPVLPKPVPNQCMCGFSVRSAVGEVMAHNED